MINTDSLITSKVADTAAAVAKVVPAVVVSVLSLQDWVYIATLAYIGLQAAWLLWKWYHAVRSNKWKDDE
jgi:hypothetical protein